MPDALLTPLKIIIGGGTAGSALAVRLSLGLPSASILLIEAGPHVQDEPGINIPGRRGSTFGGKFDWNFTTTPQKSMNNRSVAINRGKVLGGSSALNMLVWNRPAVAEYDSWETVGNRGWNWDSMLNAMKISENYTGPSTNSQGSKGPVHAVINRRIPEHQKFFIPAASSLGIPPNSDSLGGNPIGVMHQPSSIDPTHYNRSYSANTYIPMRGLNLELMTDTKVMKVEFQQTRKGQGLKATGVILEDGRKIYARKEIVLAAGSIQSPGILEVSGVGQAGVLSAANITQLIDLPGVGENLQDHVRAQISYQLKDNYTSFDILRYNTSIAAMELSKWSNGEPSWYDYTGSGILIADWKRVVGDDSNLISLAEGILETSSRPFDKEKLAFMKNPSVPQLEIIFSDGYFGVKGYPLTGTALYGNGFFALIAVLMHPLSRGSVHLNPKDIWGKPILNPSFLDNEHDIQAMIESLKFCRKLAMTDPLRSVWESEYEPGLDSVQTEQQWRQYVLNSTFSIQHPMSTCAMLPKEKGGVVDENLRVHGIENLRVVDASIIPVQISGHLQTAVYGIAERAAKMIISSASV
jgi:choline dehydrogenase-like flavoprotein